MILPTSGVISMGEINVELGRARATSISLNSAQNGNVVAIRQSASPKPSPTGSGNNVASISEWYGYQHLLSGLGFIVTAGATGEWRGYVINGSVGSISPSPANVFFTGANAVIRAVYTSNSQFILEIYNGSNTTQPSGWDYFQVGDSGPRFNRTSTNTAPYTLSSDGKWVYSFDYPTPFIGTNFFPNGSTTNVFIGGNGTADTTAPSTPTNVVISDIGSTQLSISWNSSTDNVGMAGYYIYINGSTTPAYTVNLTGSGNFGQAITGLSPSTSYYFTIKARDTSGNLSAAANSATITTNAGADTVAPSAPSSANATSITSTTLTLNWSASTDNVGVTNYLVYQNGGLLVTLGNVLNYAVSGLVASTAYTFTVKARDAAGNLSAFSNTVNATTAAASSGDTTPPTAPNFISASNTSADTIEIFWNGDTDNIGVTNYYVYRNNVYMGSSTVRSYYDYGVPSGTWFYQIYALDAAGNISPISAESNYVTIGGGGTGVAIQ